MIDLTFSKWKKDETARSEPVIPIMPKMASMIAQRRDSIVPLVPKSIPRRMLGAKSGSPLERLTTMKSDKVDSTAKVAPGPIPLAIETGSLAKKEESAYMGSCEKSTNPVF
ncbi:hypothetical protein ACFX2H_032182 [Malus domestica]